MNLRPLLASFPRRWSHAAATLALLLVPALAAAVPCVVPDNGSGTVDLPPAGCGYLSPADVHMIIDGLPPAGMMRPGLRACQ